MAVASTGGHGAPLARDFRTTGGNGSSGKSASSRDSPPPERLACLVEVIHCHLLYVASAAPGLGRRISVLFWDLWMAGVVLVHAVHIIDVRYPLTTPYGLTITASVSIVCPRPLIPRVSERPNFAGCQHYDANCQGRRDIRPCGGVKMYHRDVGVQHKCHHAAGVRRIR